jgi:hypothetical protein
VPLGGTESAPDIEACRRFEPVVGVAVGDGTVEPSVLMIVMGRGVVSGGSVTRPRP